MALSNSQLSSITQQVCQRFPELRGVSPQVQKPAGQKATSGNENFLVIYKGKSVENIVQVVRVTADAKGRVLKMSTSR